MSYTMKYHVGLKYLINVYDNSISFLLDKERKKERKST